MKTQFFITGFLALAGVVAATLAVINERRMQQHRQPGVSYAAVTFRRDGGWKKSELFTTRGLEYQALASRFGLTAAACWVAALLTFVLLAA